MTWNSGPCIDSVPEEVVTALDTINARLGWPRGRPHPCAGHMVPEHQHIDGIDVAIGSESVEVRVAGIMVGNGARWKAIGNAYIRCLLPHTTAFDERWVAALHPGGAINAYQSHLLSSHGTHSYACTSLARRNRCRICQGSVTS
ncbi:hypothetical protein GCM10009733_021280 [Nonomuraea maheshkhaliensis]|uniref:Uncharacterized protein n=1 Tax=Nonomuraea maheshkhaliensis TaxID=419590 RepID=A0ABP4QV78_9ACTN